MNGGPHAEARPGIIDAWMQHPSAEFLNDPMFESLRRWSRGQMAGGRDPGGGDDETAGLFLHGNAERVFGLAGSQGAYGV